jgi:acetyl-CoA carboxylase carboxyl transferase subunit alpha
MDINWKTVLDFEKPVYELEKKIAEMRDMASSDDPEMKDVIEKLEKKANDLKIEIYSKLNSWQRVQLARHPERPYTLDYIQKMTTNFIELHGDRLFGDDNAIVSGFAELDGKPVVMIGHQKGRDTKSNIYRNFGMPNPEGYRKALRVMRLGAKFKKPIITLIDTPGAYPGIGAEERGQAEAIAKNLFEMSHFPVPVISVVIGEGGSGGALALGVSDKIFMLENSIYSVISPEGCSAILYKDSSKAPQAAEAMKITAKDLLELKVIDDIIPEPVGGAHRNHDESAKILKEKLVKEITELEKIPAEELINKRIEKYSKMGYWTE